MPQMAGAFSSKPIWRVWGPANASYLYLVTTGTFVWADGTTATLAGHKAAYLLPAGAPALDRTASDYVILAYQNPGARPLYAVTLKDYALGASNVDTLLSPAVGTVNWAPVRWLTRNQTVDWEQY